MPVFLTTIQRLTSVVQAIGADIKALYSRAWPGQRDMTGYTGADVTLQLGEKAIYDCNGVTTLPLRLATSDRQYYKIKINPSFGVAAQSISLLMNNTNLTNGFTVMQELFNATNGTILAGGVANLQTWITLCNAFTPRTVSTDIFTGTLSKTAMSEAVLTDVGVKEVMGRFYNYSGNTTAAWTSLGTLSFTAAFTGQISVELVSHGSAVPPSNSIPALYDQLGNISEVAVTVDTATLNPADMTADTGLIIITPDGDRIIHSLANGSHKRRIRLLVSPSSLTKVILPHNSASGSASGKFFNPGGTDQHLRAGYENTYVWLSQVNGWVLEADAVGLFNATTPGLVNFSGGAKENFLRADGTWVNPTSHRRKARMMGMGSGGLSSYGLGGTAGGTANVPTMALTNAQTSALRTDYLVTTASTSAVAFVRSTVAFLTIGHASNAVLGGFDVVLIGAPATGGATTTNRYFMGLRPASNPTDVEPSSIQNIVGFGWDAADANVQLMYRGTGAVTKVSLGANFVVPTTDRAKLYKAEFVHPTGVSGQLLACKLTDLDTGAVFSQTINTNLPTTATQLGTCISCSVGGTSSVIGIAFVDMDCEYDALGYN